MFFVLATFYFVVSLGLFIAVLSVCLSLLIMHSIKFVWRWLSKVEQSL
ncbi:hypothetical protein PTUN_a2225 [Pseudoalteromonas tunicata]|nr:hypothetical protein PTUN_a2225 [Pseudoalteromonas tunicata]